MVQNPWLIFPQFCALLTNCFPQSAHNFKVVFLIDRITLWQEFILHLVIAVEETVSKPFTFDRNSRAFFGIDFPGRFHWVDCFLVSMSHSHTPMVRHQLWLFWAYLDRRWSPSISPEWSSCKITRELRSILGRQTTSYLVLTNVKKSNCHCFFGKFFSKLAAAAKVFRFWNILLRKWK